LEGSGGAPGSTNRVRGSRPLKVYAIGLVALLVCAAGANVAYQRRAAAADARHTATADARFGATIAARDIASAIALVRTAVATTAATPGIEKVFPTAPLCTLTFTRAGTFGTGHLDIIGTDGSVACTSLAGELTPGYAGATWLPDALRGPAFVGGVVDARTGKQVVLVAAPVPGKGAVVAFLDLDALGPGVASILGGPRHLEFVVLSADSTIVMARSIDSAQWVGKPVAGTPFAAPAGRARQRDLDGTSRLYGEATVDTLGWHVFAGVSTSQAVANAQRLSNRQLAVTLVGLGLLFVALSLLYRRIAHPIARLSTQVRAATARRSSGPIAVSGPREVATLVDDFNDLVAAANRELEANSRLAAIVESSADAMIGITLDGVITSWNAGAEEMYGYAADEIIGLNISAIVPSDRADELAPMLDRVRQGERVEHIDTTRVRKDGSTIDVSVAVSPVRDASGAMVGASTVARDITEAKLAVDALRVSEARKTAMLESALDAVISIDEDGRLVEFNPAAERVFGYSRTEIVGQSMADLLVPSGLREQHRAGFARYLATGETHVLGRRLELTALRADGTEFPIELAITKVDVAGPPLFTAYLRDVSEQHQQRAELDALNARQHQSERLESLGQLAGGIAHDFNNLLAAIMNYAAFVADETADRPEVLADVQQIQTAAERAARLTRQLLIFGRRGAIQTESLELNAIVTDIHNLLSRSIGEHIELRVDPSPNLPTMRADRGQVEQVLLNLAVNARDAMPDGGTLTLETAGVELDDDYARLHPLVNAGHYVELTVSDTGTGMSADVAAHIFEPFFTTKPVGQGTGLGLATVYGIVADAGGTMSVYSEEGIGTTFRLYFPVTGVPAPPSTVAPTAYTEGHGETILVVEDEPAVLELTSRILREGGYAVLEAATFPEALSLATSHDFHLLLTDSVMPEMSGSALAEQVSVLRPGRRVLFMSGYSEGVLSPQRLLDNDMTLIQKPFSRRTLLETVSAALSSRDT
jgi:PAS domain S-box-containing protein